MPNCGLLDKKSLKCPGVRGFSWSPKDNYISYWVPEQGEAPARVTIIGIPRRNEVRVKNLYNVQSIEMAWQDQVDYENIDKDKMLIFRVNTWPYVSIVPSRARRVHLPLRLRFFTLKKRKSLSIRLKWRRLLLGFNGNPRATDSVLFMASQTRSAVRCLTFRKEKSLSWSPFPIYAQLTVSSGHQLVATVSWPSCTICKTWVSLPIDSELITFIETIRRQLGLIDVLGYWCQLDHTSWLQAPR